MKENVEKTIVLAIGALLGYYIVKHYHVAGGRVV